MNQIPYDQAEQIINELLSTTNCASIYQGEWLRIYIAELIAIFPEVREHTEERTRMLKLYKEKGLL
jgi:hypothetical protein